MQHQCQPFCNCLQPLQPDVCQCPSISVKNTVTLPPGSNATVINAGTSCQAELIFGIPSATDGTQGPPGESATVDIGTTTTLPSGSEATVTNTGTSTNAILNFGIPRGEQGIQGPQGSQGPTGATGAQGPQGPSGTVVVQSTTTLSPGSEAIVINSGTPSNAQLNFGIPRGEQGPQGPAGTIQILNTVTVAAGEPADVINIGTPTNAQLRFEIPRGLTGPRGFQGNPGATGPPGATGNTGATGPQGPEGPQGPLGATGANGAQGPPGQAATISPGFVTILPPGSTPTVTNSGTSTAAVFNFGIPSPPIYSAIYAQMGRDTYNLSNAGDRQYLIGASSAAISPGSSTSSSLSGFDLVQGLPQSSTPSLVQGYSYVFPIQATITTINYNIVLVPITPPPVTLSFEYQIALYVAGSNSINFQEQYRSPVIQETGYQLTGFSALGNPITVPIRGSILLAIRMVSLTPSADVVMTANLSLLLLR